MNHKSNHISILLFGERLISRLRVRRSSRGVDVVSFDQERGAWSLQDGSLEQALKSFVAERHVAEDVVYTVLARHEMTARILTLPSQDRGELDRMIRLSAEEYVPYPVDELVIDHSILQTLPDGQSRVLAVFAHRDVVNSHVAVLEKAGIEPEEVLLSTACLASGAIAAPHAGPARYAVANLACGGLEVVVINGGRIEYARGVASSHEWDFGVRDGADAAEEAREELRVEVRASLSAYRRESDDGEGVEALYLCSEHADVSEPCDSLSHEIGLACAPASFARDLVLHGAESLRGVPLVSLGAALVAQNRGEVVIRLLPKSIHQRRKLSGVRRKAIRFGALAGVIVVLLICLYAQGVMHRMSYIRYLRGQIAQVAPRAQGVVEKQRQLRILENQVDRSGSVIELLAALCDVYPSSGLNIVRFVFTHGQGIELSGRAKTGDDVAKLTSDIAEYGKKSLPLLARATEAYRNEARERDEKVWEYGIKIPFPGTDAADLEDGTGE